MLARFVLACLLLELAVYAAVGAWLWALVLALGSRLALVCLTMTVAHVARSPRAPENRVGPLGTVRLVLGEWRRLLLDNFFYIPFERWAVRRDPAPAPGSGLPVILVHGYFSNRGYFRPLVHGLEAAGVRPVFVPSFPAIFTPIEDYVEALHAEIDRIAVQSGHGRVVLVCHSMGGLAAREYLRRNGAARIAKLVTIASPHHGSVIAYVGVGANAEQMRPGSAFLAGLEEAERVRPPAIAATSVYSCHDNLVVPQDTSRLPWAKNLVLPGVGHLDILGSERLLEVVLRELREARA